MGLDSFTMKDLAAIIDERKEATVVKRIQNTGSYTSMLLEKGAPFIERKLLEETAEVILESHDGNREKLIAELGDLFYHALVLAAFHNISLRDIEEHLSNKHIRCSLSGQNGSFR